MRLITKTDIIYLYVYTYRIPMYIGKSKCMRITIVYLGKPILYTHIYYTYTFKLISNIETCIYSSTNQVVYICIGL